MAMNENVPGIPVDLERKKTAKPILHPLHEAAMRIADLGLNRSRAKTKDLLALLLTHGARGWRATQPEAGIHLHVMSPENRMPVRMRIR
ncbi:hypothetical protein [Pararhizobium sp.]|uniref:hypothetical protein n=1 Tax=Pararhizobium sp. TaxID=1977563 RepID=UPI002727B23B|nr:hypothetical protein [Pararhizobium sp.]MDO9415334.1 hypothetical protein [Pararhizobium sp.]